MKIMKYSKQRELIEISVKNSKAHPTADDIYSILKPSNPNLSLGTVYRNLNTLAEKNVIRKINMPNGSDRFDSELNEHYHVICTECGEIFDVKIVVMNTLKEKIKSKIGVNVTSVQLVVNGVCDNCIKEAKKTS